MSRSIKWFIVVVFVLSWCLPAAGDVGFAPGSPGTFGTPAAFSWWAWVPACPEGAKSAPLTQEAYDALVSARFAGVRLFRAPSRCDASVQEVRIVPRPGEDWGEALYRVKRGGLVPGVELHEMAAPWLIELIGAEHTGHTRQALRELCQAGFYGRPGSCVPSDHEITYAGGSASTAAALPGAQWIRLIGNGTRERAAIDPSMPQCSEPVVDRSLVWGVEWWFKGPCGGVKPPRKPRVEPSCSDRPPSCNCQVPVVYRPDLPPGFVMVETHESFGVTSGHCNLAGWPEKGETNEAKAPGPVKCRWPGSVTKLEMVKPGTVTPCCGDGGAVDTAQELLVLAYDALGNTECPGGENPKTCCMALEAGQAAILEALEKLGAAGCP